MPEKTNAKTNAKKCLPIHLSCKNEKKHQKKPHQFLDGALILEFKYLCYVNETLTAFKPFFPSSTS